MAAKDRRKPVPALLLPTKCFTSSLSMEPQDLARTRHRHGKNTLLFSSPHVSTQCMINTNRDIRLLGESPNPLYRPSDLGFNVPSFCTRMCCWPRTVVSNVAGTGDHVWCSSKQFWKELSQKGGTRPNVTLIIPARGGVESWCYIKQRRGWLGNGELYIRGTVMQREVEKHAG